MQKIPAVCSDQQFMVDKEWQVPPLPTGFPTQHAKKPPKKSKQHNFA